MENYVELRVAKWGFSSVQTFHCRDTGTMHENIYFFYLSTENCHKEGFQDPSSPYGEGNNENAYFCHDLTDCELHSSPN